MTGPIRRNPGRLARDKNPYSKPGTGPAEQARKKRGAGRPRKDNPAAKTAPAKAAPSKTPRPLNKLQEQKAARESTAAEKANEPVRSHPAKRAVGRARRNQQPPKVVEQTVKKKPGRKGYWWVEVKKKHLPQVVRKIKELEALVDQAVQTNTAATQTAPSNIQDDDPDEMDIDIDASSFLDNQSLIQGTPQRPAYLEDDDDDDDDIHGASPDANDDIPRHVVGSDTLAELEAELAADAEAEAAPLSPPSIIEDAAIAATPSHAPTAAQHHDTMLSLFGSSPIPGPSPDLPRARSRSRSPAQPTQPSRAQPAQPTEYDPFFEADDEDPLLPPSVIGCMTLANSSQIGGFTPRR